MTRELSSEGWAVDKLRMVSQIEPKYRKWTPGVTGTIDKDKCNRSVIGPLHMTTNPYTGLSNIEYSVHFF